ncbi:carbohydrate ABC transporter permease [Xylanivirga thermophila]|uniref:carbohydrate ABC transporter permease n=1 Tax=Xylanivirga thermophila TaxID=2496273 RepID=UPI00101DB01E|nr:carbohydrate ABC transporter permease [Xylanivirga thermophila]
MINKRTTGEKVFDVINVIIMILLMISCLYPMLYVLFASISDPKILSQHRGILLKPLGFTLKGYDLVFSNPNISSGYINTIFYVIIGTAINIFMTSLGAYVLSRRNLYWRKLITFLITFTMFFGGGLIPYYLLVQKLGLINTRAAMIIPGAVSTWNLIVMRTSFLSIPDSLEESARLDGANDFTILFKIILPLSKATIAVMTLFYAVGHWNEWFNAMIFLRDRDLFPLQLILREILITNDTKDMTIITDASQLGEQDIYKSLVQYCTIIVATVPILFIYPFLQKYFVKGVMIGSVKG